MRCKAVWVLAWALAMHTAATATSMLRIACDDEAAGAMVTVNGRQMGECPLDMQVQPGQVTIQSSKPRDAETQWVFEQSLFLGDGVVKRIELTFSKTVLTAEGMRQQQAREQERQRQEAARLREEAAAKKKEGERQRLAAEAARQHRLKLDAAMAAARAQGAEPGNGKPFRDCPDCPPMVIIKGVDGDPVAMGQFEITRGQYEAFVTDTKRPPSRGCRVWNSGIFSSEAVQDANATWLAPGFEQTKDHPVVCVSWNEVQAYLAWLSAKAGVRYVLPGKSDWIEAWRQNYPAIASSGNFHDWSFTGGNAARVCPLGNLLDSTGWSQGGRGGTGNGANEPYPCSDGFGKTAPVGHFAVGATGLHDLIGNVSELLSGVSRAPDNAIDLAQSLANQYPSARDNADKSISIWQERKALVVHDAYGSSWLFSLADSWITERDDMRTQWIGFRVMRPFAQPEARLLSSP